jgi:hypothetical protein
MLEKIKQNVRCFIIVSLFFPPAGVFSQPLQPKIIFWAWERKENLEYINPETAGIAFLAKTILIKGDFFEVIPRLQPLMAPSRAWLCAVVRIQVSGAGAQLSQLLAEEVSGEISSLADLEGVSAIQIDFDAAISERAFYNSLLVEVRKRLGKPYPLSITALASWCVYDDWLQQLPVHAVVPMFFRMGPDRAAFLHYLQSGRLLPVCRENAGIAIDEPLTRLPDKQHIYVFNPKAWTENEARNIMKELE